MNAKENKDEDGVVDERIVKRTRDELEKYVKVLEQEIENLVKQNMDLEHKRNESIHYLHNNMFQKLLEAEAEYEQESARLEKENAQLREQLASHTSQKNDNNENNNHALMEKIEELTKDNENLKKELENCKMMNDNLEKTRRNSLTAVSQNMFYKYLGVEQSKKEEKNKFEEEIEQLRQKISKYESIIERYKNNENNNNNTENNNNNTNDQNEEEALRIWKEKALNLEKELEKEETIRRESVSAYQQTMWKNILEAEDESKKLQLH